MATRQVEERRNYGKGKREERMGNHRRELGGGREDGGKRKSKR
jgi:hypothetical protein